MDTTLDFDVNDMSIEGWRGSESLLMSKMSLSQLDTKSQTLKKRRKPFNFRKETSLNTSRIPVQYASKGPVNTSTLSAQDRSFDSWSVNRRPKKSRVKKTISPIPRTKSPFVKRKSPTGIFPKKQQSELPLFPSTGSLPPQIAELAKEVWSRVVLLELAHNIDEDYRKTGVSKNDITQDLDVVSEDSAAEIPFF